MKQDSFCTLTHEYLLCTYLVPGTSPEQEEPEGTQTKEQVVEATLKNRAVWSHVRKDGDRKAFHQDNYRRPLGDGAYPPQSQAAAPDWGWVEGGVEPVQKRRH